MGWFRGLSGNEVCGHYHQTECNAGTGIVCFEDAIALGVVRLRICGPRIKYGVTLFGDFLDSCVRLWRTSATFTGMTAGERE